MESNNKIKDKLKELTPILAVYDDIPQINEIIISFWGEKSVYDYQFYYRVLSSNLSYSYKIDKELVAICLVELDLRKKIISIALLCVKKAYQRNGLGESLLKYCLKNCLKIGYSEIFLNVATTNSVAIKLYKKLGFREIKIVKDYYIHDSPPDRDAYLMKYEIKSQNDDYKDKKWMRGKSYENDNKNYTQNYYTNDRNFNNQYNYDNYYNNNYYRFHYHNYPRNYYDGNNYNYRNYNFDSSNYSHYREGYWNRYNRGYH